TSARPVSVRRSHRSSAASAGSVPGRRSPIEAADAKTGSIRPGSREPSNMVLRVGSAVVLIVVVVAALAAGSPWVYAAMAVFLGVALLEFLALTRALGSTAPWWLLFPLSYALLLRDRLPLWLDLTAVLAIAAVAGLGIMVFVRD